MLTFVLLNQKSLYLFHKKHLTPCENVTDMR
jgi:hypothetical protein